MRSLARSPGFATVALLTLALGIGANTTMFSVLRTIVERTLPYPDQSRLVYLHRTADQSQNLPHSVANFLDLHAQQTAFAHLAAFQWASFNLALPGEPAEVLRGLRTTADFFAVLGVPPTLGRVFNADEHHPGQDRVVVLSHRCWTSRFARDPAIVGRDIRLGGEAVTVVGVMPPEFEDPLLWGQVDAWRPLAFSETQRSNRRSNYLRVIAQLAPALSRAQAEARLRTLWSQLVAAHDTNARTDLRLAPMNRGTMVDDGQVSWFVMALAALVLLIACANLANLQFARTAARAREFAVRASLGATRARLLRDVLAESLLLSLAGGALGLLVALWTNDLLGRHFLVGATLGLEFRIDFRVLAFATVASTAAGVGFGLLPAWLAARTDVTAALKQGGYSLTASRAQHRLRHALIVAEVALALILLATASLFIRGLQRAQQRDLGWQIDRLVAGYLSIQTPPNADTPEKRTAYRAAFTQQLQDELATLPGVARVALGSSLPTYGFSASTGFSVHGRPPPRPGAIPSASFAWVTPDYFSTLGLRLVAGRSFTADDRAGTAAVTIVNETMARTLFPGEIAVGQRLDDPVTSDPREIVGVVTDVRPAATFDLGGPGFQTYRPYAQNPSASLSLALRTHSAPETLAAEIRRIVARLNPEQPIHDIGPLRREVDRQFHNLRLAGWTLSAFALLGLFLATLGIYAVLAHAVVQRTNEIGIRMALGAQVRDILTLVLGQGLRLALLGTALGLVGALGVARILRAFAPALAELDYPALTFVATLLLLAAALACWLPARRAARVDPIAALRAE